MPAATHGTNLQRSPAALSPWLLGNGLYWSRFNAVGIRNQPRAAKLRHLRSLHINNVDRIRFSQSTRKTQIEFGIFQIRLCLSSCGAPRH
jgi:hypothetical protein